MRLHLSETPLSIDGLLADSDRDDCGALVLFAGTVRNHHAGAAVTRLVYSAHAALAAQVIATVERETCTRFGIGFCRIVHRIGALAIGDVAILAAVRAAHRAEAFAAAEWAVTAVKERAPIWKEEFFPDGRSVFVQGASLLDSPDTPAGA